MTTQQQPVNTVANLPNVQLCMTLMQRLISRDLRLPGMGVFYGPSGFGKSTAASYIRNKLDAYYIECKDSWTKKALHVEILKEMGIRPEGSTYDMYVQICENLANTEKALIVDEMDVLVEKKAIEAIRSIYEGSQAPVLLIGEEQLPKKLEKWEKFHGRILDWVGAEPIRIEDAVLLSSFYCPNVEVSEDLFLAVFNKGRGSARRMSTNFANIARKAKRLGIDSIGFKEFPETDLYIGRATTRRIAQ